MSANRVFRKILACSLLTLAAAATTLAQNNMPEKPGGDPPILVVNREVLKPGMSGAQHDATEASYAQLVIAAGSPIHYVGMTSLSGADEALYFGGYGSVADWGKAEETMNKNTKLTRALDLATRKDAALLESSDTMVFERVDDLSLGSHSPVGSRYYRINVWNVRPGHNAEFHDYVQLVMNQLKKVDTTEHWTVYKQILGDDYNMYIQIVAMKDAAELDRFEDNNNKLHSSMSPQDARRFEELAGSVLSRSTNFFVLKPGMSVPPQRFVDGDPAFWTVKSPAPTAGRKPTQR